VARALGALLACSLLLSGCTDDGSPDDPLQITDNPVAAKPAKSPKITVKPAGRVVRKTDSPAGLPGRTARVGDRTLIARGKAGLEVLRDGEKERVIRGKLASADQVLAVGGKAVVLDRLRSAVFEVDVQAGKIGLGLRAGQGATNAVVDEYDRVLVVDTRMGALLAFSVDPLLLRQRYPVAGSPYGIAYDSKRDIAWVTLTETNEVVGFDVAGGEPKELHRFPTVRQPNSVTVDEHTGSVVVASAAGEGFQVIEP
jgi:hypothetical protein